MSLNPDPSEDMDLAQRVEAIWHRLADIGMTPATLTSMRLAGSLKFIARICHQVLAIPVPGSGAFSLDEYQQQWQKWEAALTDEARTAVRRHTYGNQTRLSRSSTTGEYPPILELVRALQSAFVVEAQAPRAYTVWRGCGLELFGDRVPYVGQVVLEPGFIATSIDREEALQYATKGVLMRIDVPQGYAACPVYQTSVLPDELEVLLPSDTVLIVTGVSDVQQAAVPFVSYFVEAVVVPT